MTKQAKATKPEEETPSVETTPEETTTPDTDTTSEEATAPDGTTSTEETTQTDPQKKVRLKVTAAELTIGKKEKALKVSQGATLFLPYAVAKKIQDDKRGEILTTDLDSAAEKDSSSTENSSIPHYDY